MVNIEISNSYSKVVGLTTEQFKAAKKLLSYTVGGEQAAYYRKGFGPTVKYLLDAKGYFPTGLLTRLTNHLKRSNILYTVKDTRVVPTSKGKLFKLNLGPVKPYPFQLAAKNMTLFKERGGIVATTGAGKSLIIALIANLHQMRTLLVVPSLEIKKQLQASMDQYFGKNNKNLRIENIDSKGLKDATDYDCLIIDECHHAAAKTYQTLNKTAWKGIYRRYFLTATFFRNQEAEQLLFESIAGDVIFELTYREAVAEGIVRPVESYYVTLPKRQVEGYTWAQVYKELVVQREDRNALIADLIALLNSNRIPTLCLVKEIEHGNLLSKLVNAPFVNGQDEDSRGYLRDFNEGKIKALIGTTGVLGEGVDTKPAEYIIVAGLGKAKSAFMQWVGRGVRNYPGKETCKVIIFDDPSHKWTKSHFKTQKEILIDEYGVEPVALKE